MIYNNVTPASTVALLDSNGYYTSDNIESAMSEIFSRHEKNYMINGNFDIWQRGTSFTNPANGAYTADRIKCEYSVDGGSNPSITVSRQQFSSGEMDKSFYYYRFAVSGTGASYGNAAYYLLHLQNIENGTRLLATGDRKVTVSFKIKNSIEGKQVGLYIRQHYGTGGSPSPVEIVTGETYTLSAGEWTTITKTFTLNSLSGKTFGTNNDDRIEIRLFLYCGSSYLALVGASGAFGWGSSPTIDIAQVACYKGDTDLDYVSPVPAEEELKCMRYYEKSFRRDTTPANGSTTTSPLEAQYLDRQTAIGIVGLGGGSYVCRFKVKKRTTPVVTIYGTSEGKVVLDNGTGTATYASYYDYGYRSDSHAVICPIWGASTAPQVREMLLNWTADADF